jgi:RND family efflux transporter MFP subunit
MSRRVWIGVALVVVVAVGVGGSRLLAARKAPATPVAAVEAGIELSASDWVTAASQEIVQSLPLTGSLRAVDSAMVKSRVAGELQGLAVREGDAVRAGQEIARIDPTEARARLRQAQEQADAARTQVEIAQRQFDNNQALVDQGFISRTALQTSQSTLAGAQATHQAALAAVDVARKTLEDTVLRAPMAGVVSQRLAQPGERLPVDARVLEIVDPTRLELEASISGADSLRVRVGQSARLEVEGAAQPVTATVVRINPSAQAGTRSVPVYLRVPAGAGLRQGLFAQGPLQVGRAIGVAVPLASVRTDKPLPYVQVVQDGRIAHRPVQVGARGERDGVAVAIVTGLTDGTQTLLGHVGALREGALVRLSQAQATGQAEPATPAASAARPASAPRTAP